MRKGMRFRKMMEDGERLKKPEDEEEVKENGGKGCRMRSKVRNAIEEDRG